MYSSADLVTANIDAASAVLVSRFQCVNCCSDAVLLYALHLLLLLLLGKLR